MSLAAGSQLGSFEVLSLIGTGGMGEVYLAQDTNLDRQVALKVLPPDIASDPERKRRFLREAKAASSLTHPNICIIHEVGETDAKQLFIVMEYVDGETLQRRIGEGPMKTADLVTIGLQVADAMETAARQRHHAPGPQAGQPDGYGSRSGEGARFRPCKDRGPFPAGGRFGRRDRLEH
jgi:eukaryotic-like serine/threonine-protein kinase